MRGVLDHLHAHLDAPPDLNLLADIAGLSPYHWHRIYKGLQGETIHATVSRLRLQRAAKLLADGELSLDVIARRAGFSAVPPFSRAFRKAYGLAPGRYRAAGPHVAYRSEERASPPDGPVVQVREQPHHECLAVPHTGRYLDVDRAFSTLFRALATAQVSLEPLLSIGVYFDDPSIVEPSRLESLACVADVPGDLEIDGLERWSVPAGPHAVLRHRGPYDALESAYDWLFSRWLPDSGHEPVDRPMYEVYLDDPRTTPPMELRVDVCLPLLDRDGTTS